MPSQKAVGAVVVTGLGATTPLGGDVASTWAAMLEGRSGAGRLRDAWADGLPVRIAARAAVEPGDVLGPVQADQSDRATQFLLVALREAWADAGFTGPADGRDAPRGDRVGVCVGTGIAGLPTILTAHEAMRRAGPGAVPAGTWAMMMVNGPAARASVLIGARAGAHTLVSACASGAEAIAYGVGMIRAGRADVVAAGGADATIHPLAIAAFARISSLSRNNDEPDRASRPFDKSRDGFVMAEGAGVLVLESAAHARARGARIYCEAAGAGLSSEAYHMVAPEPSGRGMREALRRALADGRLTPRDISHVNAHATSTSRGDLAESRALVSVLGTGGYCVSATKSMTGHLIGGAGSIEAVATVLAVRDRLAPPTINVDDLDDAIEPDIVRDGPRPLAGGRIAALCNSSGFGGHNVVLAFVAGRVPEGRGSLRPGAGSSASGATATDEPAAAPPGSSAEPVRSVPRPR